tara:strand:+ start:3167 stop:3721 length:555 start_codon:yes stop_codon:yes gene_type:complete
MFSAPIPGQSLTSEPKNSSWENPPLITEPEEALLWHLEKLESPKRIEGIGGLLVLGLDLVTLTEGLLRTAVADGVHSIDISLIIAPVIHEYIKGIADASNVDYEEGIENEDEELDLSSLQMTLRKKEAQKILDDIKSNKDIDLSTLEEPVDSMEEEPMINSEPQVVDIPPQENKPMGLMSRGVS